MANIIDELTDEYNISHYIDLLLLKKQSHGIIFTNDLFDFIEGCIKKAFEEVFNEKSEKVFDIQKDAKAFIFTSLYELVKARSENEFVKNQILAITGIYISAFVISNYADDKQKLLYRAISLNWYRLRVSREKKLSIMLWNDKLGWREYNEVDALKNIKSHAINLLTNVGCDTLKYVNVIDDAFNISFNVIKEKSIKVPNSFKNIAYSVDERRLVYVDDDADEIIPLNDENYTFLANFISNLSSNDTTFSIEKLKSSISYENKADFNIFMFDNSNESNMNRRLKTTMSYIDVHDRLNTVIIKKSNDGIGFSHTGSTPSVINPRLCKVKLDIGNANKIKLAQDYINKIFSSDYQKDLFMCLNVNIFLNRHMKKLFYLYGIKGDEGKSTIISILELVYGNSLPMDKNALFGYSKNGTSHTEYLSGVEDASMLTVGDAPNKPIIEDATKQFSGYDNIYHRGLAAKRSQVLITAPIVITTNHIALIPPSGSIAVYNRFVFLELKTSFIDKKVYKSYASEVCEKCALYYSSSKKAKIKECTHSGKPYLDYKGKMYCIRDDEIDIKGIAEGLLAMMFKVINDGVNEKNKKYKSYIKNTNEYLNHDIQILERFKVFLNSFMIIETLKSYGETSIENMVSSFDSLKSSLFDFGFRNNVYEKIKERYKVVKDMKYNEILRNMMSIASDSEFLQREYIKIIRSQL